MVAVKLAGDLTNAGTRAPSGTLLFAGTANQTFTPGAATVATLVLNNTGPAGQLTLSLPTHLTVGTALTLQSGLLRTAAALTLPDGATLSGEGPVGQGNLRITRTVGSGVLDFGHGLSLDRTGLGQVTATRPAGLLTDNLSRVTSLPNAAGKSIDRIWTVQTTAAPTAAVPVTLQWLADDDNGLTSFSPAQAWRADVGTSAWAATGAAQAVSKRGHAQLLLRHHRAGPPHHEQRRRPAARGADPLHGRAAGRGCPAALGHGLGEKQRPF